MKILFLALLLAFPICACAAGFEVFGNHANLEADASCAVVDTLAPGSPVMFHARWTGPKAGEDSLAGSADAPFSFKVRKIPTGTYQISYWWSGAFTVPCPPVTVSWTVVAKPRNRNVALR